MGVVFRDVGVGDVFCSAKRGLHSGTRKPIHSPFVLLRDCENGVITGKSCESRRPPIARRAVIRALGMTGGVVVALRHTQSRFNRFGVWLSADAGE
jgi:hypothetical protein